MHTQNRRWWREDFKGDRHGAVWSSVMALAAGHTNRLALLRAWYSLYREPPGVDLAVLGQSRRSRTRDNVVQNGIDTALAMWTTNRPRPWIVTTGGKWSTRRAAKRRNLYIDGEFDRLEVYEHSLAAAQDALIYGDGAVKVYAKDGRPAIERVWVGELLADPREARQNSVRTLYQVKAVDKEVLSEMFPDQALDIERGTRIEAFLEGEEAITSDIIHVIEAWHLPAGKPSETRTAEEMGGRHVICVHGACLVDEPWEKEFFPFAKLPWFTDPRGFWGIGLAERMAGSQAEIDEMNEIISDCFSAAVPSVWTPSGSGVNREMMDDVPWRNYAYSNMSAPPTFVTPAAINDQHLMRTERLKQDAYGNQGISEMSARAEKPAGLNSGKALRIHHDIENRRFSAQGRKWEAFHMELARLIFDTTCEIAEDPEAAKQLSVYVGRQTLDAIKYDEIKIPDGQHYEVRTFPVSSLSSTPEGRLRDVEDLISLGILSDPNDVRELLDYPDLERFNEVESAGRDLADKLIEEAISGKRVAANEYIPLDYAHRKAILLRSLAEIEGSENLDHLDNLIGHIETLLAKSQPPPMPMPPPGAGQPPPAGMGGPPPMMM